MSEHLPIALTIDPFPQPVQAAIEANYAVVPADLSKRPNCRWKKWTTEPQTEQDRAQFGFGSLWAVVVGEQAGVVVLDFDGPEGLETMDRLGLTPHVKTANGCHVYATYPGHPVKSSAKKFPAYPGLDIKGDKSFAYFYGRSKKGAYEPMNWPPVPIELPAELAEELFPHPQETARNTVAAGAYEGPVPEASRYLTRAADRVRFADEGTSNAVLNKQAYTVGGLVASGQLDEETAYRVLLEAAVDRGAGTPGEVIRSSFASGAEKPWAFQHDKVDAEWQEVTSQMTQLLGVSDADVRPLTDLGNAERLVDRFGDEIRWVADVGCWYVWDGGRWVRDQGATRVRFLTQETAQQIHVEAAREGLDRSDQGAVSKWALASQNASRLRAMEEQARYRPEVQALRDDFDTHPRLVNAANGTFELDTGRLRSHRREDRLTKILPVAYDESATCPTWDSVLERALPDADMRGFLQRALGTGLLGQVPDRSFFVMHGKPGTGKSIVVETLAMILGEYALKAKPEAVVQTGRGSGPTPELAELEGRRLVYVSETESNAKMAVARVKDMTGSGRINGRRNREDGGEFALLATILMDTNHVPQMGADEGAWDRIHLLPFDEVVPAEGRRDRHDLLAALRGEASGILNWLVAGATAYLADGLQTPQRSLALRETMRADEDLVGQFLEDCCDRGDGLWDTTQNLHGAYTEWCESNGFEELRSKNVFGKELANHGLVSRRSKSSRRWVGAKLRDAYIADPGGEYMRWTENTGNSTGNG